MRGTCWFSIVLVAFMLGCGDRSGTGDRDRIDLSQNVTVSGRALDPVFKDFSQSWRQFISKNPELAIPVTGSAPKPAANSPQPIVTSECVFARDAQGYVPQVSLTWDEPSEPVVEPLPGAAPKRAEKAQNQQGEAAIRRFDLGLHHDPFGRKLFSSVMSTDRLQRFNLPPDSALVNNPEAVLLTGPGLFPKLMEYRALTVRDRSTNRPFLKQTVVLRELSEGITTTMRVSHRVRGEWNTDQQFIFLVPVCPTRF